MNYRSITVLSIMAAALVMAACTKDDDRKDYPSTQPDQKVTNVYETSSIKTEIFVGKEWKTQKQQTNARILKHEFFWEGNRLEGLDNHDRDFSYSFEYDDFGRIYRVICDGGRDFSRVLTYDDKGMLAHSEGTIKTGDAQLISRESLDFTWENGLLKTIEEDSWTKNEVEEGKEITRKGTRTYTWEGGNVVKTSRHIVTKDGDKESVDDCEYDIEYTNIDNPLHGFIFLIHPYTGIIFDFEGIDCLSKNLPSHITPSKDRVYDFSYSGSPITNVKKTLVAETPVLRLSLDYDLDFEY
ncbi:MAG: hypothetical protein J6O51_02170 [Bacteroidales bacterium]|nr:hypothetical protein [Bacteroidales bacterium]